MSYINNFEAELRKKIESSATPLPELLRWVTEKVLESYHNGITAGQKGETVKRQGESRRRGSFGKKAE